MEVSIAASPPSECNEREGPSTFEPAASTRRPRRTKRPCPPTEKGRMACRPTTRQHKATTQDGSTRGAVTKSFDAGKDQDNHSSAGSRCSSTRCSSSAGSVALSHPLFFVCGERCSSTRCACAYNKKVRSRKVPEQSGEPPAQPSSTRADEGGQPTATQTQTPRATRTTGRGQPGGRTGPETGPQTPKTRRPEPSPSDAVSDTGRNPAKPPSRNPSAGTQRARRGESLALRRANRFV